MTGSKDAAQPQVEENKAGKKGKGGEEEEANSPPCLRISM
jgi:hypothetical protein